MELLIPVDSRDKRPLYQQIYAYIRGEIREGGLRHKERLPSTRVLAENLKVSRSTTQMAYEQLLAEGYIEGRLSWNRAGNFGWSMCLRTTQSIHI